jgi:hypothetical protein
VSETGEPAQPPPTGPSSHRAETPPGPAGRLLAPLAAVLVVIIVVVLLIVINGHHSKGTPNAAATPGVSATPTAVTSPPATPKSGKPKPKPKPKHTPTAKPKPKPKPTRTHHVTPPPPTAMAPVQVLNNSRRSGLAHEVAAEVQGRGWAISKVGNLQGLVAETTVYYAPGDAGAAQHLANEFSSIRRVEPNSEGRIHASGLTLVLTRDWGE